MNTVVQRQANSETIGRLRVRYVTAHRLQLQREIPMVRSLANQIVYPFLSEIVRNV